MRALLLASVLLSSFSAFAADTRALSEARRKQLSEVSFFCPVGRQPVLDSSFAWQLRPFPGCSFKGPLDTKIHPLRLEAPVLNPLLTLAGLKAGLRLLGLQIDSENLTSLSFRLPSGARLTASQIAPKNMQDPLFHFDGVPMRWGRVFLSIAASEAGAIPAFLELAKALPGNPFFWTNPHYAEELVAHPHLLDRKTYTPVNLLSKCGGGAEWRNFGGLRSLLVVGDLHNPPEIEFFREVLASRTFAWVGLEMSLNLRPVLDRFLAASDTANENAALDELLFRYSKDKIENTRAMLRELKRSRVEIVFLNSDDTYFNFPYTNVAFHGMVLSTRNFVWAKALPEWKGTGLMLAGLDHFLDIPGSDFQDYLLERFPGTELGLISPYEKCTQ